MIGEVVGGYKISAKIGEGGMGVVFLAHHTIMGRRAVVKVLRSQLSSNREMVQRFFNEARAAAAISHPGIVSVFDMGQREDGSAYIVMDFLEGESLARRLRRCGRLSSEDAMAITRQILSALSAAHERGIVHRDLKPDNIFLVKDSELPGGERIKLLDFGIAKLQGETGPGVLTTQAGALMGTPTYMSPEQCRGAGQCDQRADLYAVGVMLFELLTGSPPFQGEAHGDLMAAHMRDAPPKLRDRVSGMSQGLEEIVATLLAKSPADRFQSGELVIESLDTLTGGRFASIRRDSSPLPPDLPMDPLAPTLLGDASEVSPEKGTTMRDSAGSMDVVEDPRRGKRRFWVGSALTIAGLAAVAAIMAQQAGSDSDSEPETEVAVTGLPFDAASAVPEESDAAPTAEVVLPTPLADALPPLSFEPVEQNLTESARRLVKKAARKLRVEVDEEATEAEAEEALLSGRKAALAVYVKAINTDPGHIISRYNYASLLNVMGQSHEAFAILKEIGDAGCPQCLGRLIRARNDVDWESSWEDPKFLEMTQRVRLVQPSASESGTMIGAAFQKGALEELAPLITPRGTIWLRVRPAGCKKNSCLDKHKIIGPERLLAWYEDGQQSVEVGEQRCHKDCCKFTPEEDAPLQLVKACTVVDSGSVRSITDLEFLTNVQSHMLED
jgi:serine/threonine-protein kinase